MLACSILHHCTQTHTHTHTQTPLIRRAQVASLRVHQRSGTGNQSSNAVVGCGADLVLSVWMQSSDHMWTQMAALNAALPTTWAKPTKRCRLMAIWWALPRLGLPDYLAVVLDPVQWMNLISIAADTGPRGPLISTGRPAGLYGQWCPPINPICVCVWGGGLDFLSTRSQMELRRRAKTTSLTVQLRTENWPTVTLNKVWNTFMNKMCNTRFRVSYVPCLLCLLSRLIPCTCPQPLLSR